MATFAKTTFNTARYASARPTYPRQLFDFVFQHHERTPGARWDTAVDLGCGTGQATIELTPFKNIVGVDPSAGMIEKATQGVQALGLADRVRFVQSAAESLAFVEDGSVDLVVSAQAAHWFDWATLWPEAARILRSGGTLAAWGYSEFRLARYPFATPLIHAYAQGADPRDSIGPHWEQPGRTILDNHLQAIPDAPRGAFSACERVYFTGTHHAGLPAPRPVILRKRTTWAGLMEYLRTFSALHTFQERNPEDAGRADGDVALRFWRRLKEEVAAREGRGLPGDEEEVEVEWPMALILATRA
ncbi:S-adenosyl-L-methionine-dependent methyltransferase [Amylocystis lapponica]|nr:S-adenosyl-L-methionine-dependent methyltransferase [Amylocystis lapponica]